LYLFVGLRWNSAAESLKFGQSLAGVVPGSGDRSGAKEEPDSRKEKIMPTQSLREKISVWKVLSTNLKARLPELPHLTEHVTLFEELVTSAEALESQQGIYIARLRETNKERTELEKRARTLRNRLAASLQGAYGPDSQTLHEFGVKPRIQRPRKKAGDTVKKKDEKAAEAAAG
jgi:chromosome segregation ATPase